MITSEGETLTVSGDDINVIKTKINNQSNISSIDAVSVELNNEMQNNGNK